jgi:hypothetical protein
MVQVCKLVPFFYGEGVIGMVIVVSEDVLSRWNMYRFRKLILVPFCVLVTVAAAAQSITLRPVDTGNSVVTFNIGSNRGVRGVDRDFRKVRVPRAKNFPASGADRMMLKTNLVYALGLQTPNVAFEYGITPRSSVEAAIGYNRWGNLWDFSKAGSDYDPDNLYKSRLDHFFVKAEYHYWLRERFAGHYVGGGLFFSKFNAGEFRVPGLFERVFDHYGNLYGIDAVYGWRWRFSRRWAAEFSVGAGMAVSVHDKSSIAVDAESGGIVLYNPVRETKIFFGPTQIGVKIVFTIK